MCVRVSVCAYSQNTHTRKILPLINVLQKIHRCMLSLINNMTFELRQGSEGWKVLTFKTEKCACHSVCLTNWHIFHRSVKPETIAQNKTSTGKQRGEGQIALKACGYSKNTIYSLSSQEKAFVIYSNAYNNPSLTITDHMNYDSHLSKVKEMLLLATQNLLWRSLGWTGGQTKHVTLTVSIYYRKSTSTVIPIFP